MERAPLNESSGNPQTERAVDAWTRGRIVGAARFRDAPVEISKALEIPESTVRDVMASDHDEITYWRNKPFNIPKPGRRSRHTERQKRALIHSLQSKSTIDQLPLETAANFSDSALRSIKFIKLECQGENGHKAKVTLSSPHERPRLS